MPEQLQLSISIDEANIILSALGNLPYVQVHHLIHNLQSQLGPQLLELDKGHAVPSNGKAIKTPVS